MRSADVVICATGRARTFGAQFFGPGQTVLDVGINFDTNDWFAFDVKSGADDYGEYLASTGSRDAVVTYTNIDDKPLDGEARKYCLVRVWTPA